MTACATFESGHEILADYQAVKEAERDLRWRSYVESTRRIVPALMAVSEQIELGWYDLPPHMRDQAVELRRMIRAAMDDASKQAARLNFAARVTRSIRAVWWALHQKEMFPYFYACSRFMIAVDRALANETRRRRRMDDAMEHNSDLRREIAQGEADFERGRRKRYTREEFATRFNLT